MIDEKKLRQALPGRSIDVYNKLKKDDKKLKFNTVYQRLNRLVENNEKLKQEKKKKYVVKEGFIFKETDEI